MPAAASRAGELPAVYRMWVHTFDFSEAELVLSAPLLEKLRLSPGDLVEITPESDDGGAAQLAVPRPVSPQTAEPPSPMPVAIGGGIPDLADTAEPLVLRVSSPPPAAKSAMQLSVLKSVADAFGLGQRQTVCVRQVAPASVAVDWAELAFKDQHLGRGDIWHCRQQLVQEATALHVGKTFVRSGAKMQVLSMARRGGAVRSGVILERSRLTFRSRSAAFILLVQVSPEMWTPTPTGDVCYERALAFLSSLFERWASLGVSHSLTVVLFARCFADDAAPASAQPRAADADASAGPDGPPTAACAVSAQSAASATSVADASAAGSAAAGVREAPLMRDVAGRQYTDYYKTVVESESRADWHSLLAPLRREILAFRSSLTRREPATSTLPGGAPAVPLRARPGRLSAAAQGNLLEAINLSLDVLEGPAATAPAARALAPPGAWRTGSYEEADLASSGKSIIVVTGGSGWFEVDEGLTQMTKQRMVDNGIGCDLVCATCPPLHTTPLFTFVHETAPGSLRASGPPLSSTSFRVPHWILTCFTDAPPPPPHPPCRLTPPPPRPAGSPLTAHGVPPLACPPGLDADPAACDASAFAASAAAYDASLRPAFATGGEISRADTCATLNTSGSASIPQSGSARCVKLADVHVAECASHCGASASAGGLAGAGGLAAPSPCACGARAYASSPPPPLNLTACATVDEGQWGSIGAFGGAHSDMSTPGSSPPGTTFGCMPGCAPTCGDAAGVQPSAAAEQSRIPYRPFTLSTERLPRLPAPQSFSDERLPRVGLGVSSRYPSTDRLPRCPSGAALDAGTPGATAHGSTNPFSLRVPADAADAAQFIRGGKNSSIPTEGTDQSYIDYQWTSLSEPAVLPLTTEATPEQAAVIRRQQAAESSWWSLAVPKQSEVALSIPYARAMSAEELLQELVCQRLEADFQLLERGRPGGGTSRSLSLRDEQTYYLALGGQVQQITFVRDDTPLPPPQSRMPRMPRAAAVSGAPTPPASGAADGADAADAISFSEIKVTRYFITPSAARAVRGFVYDYMVWGPHSHGFQRFLTRIRPAAPLDAPWNRTDQTVCGWESELELGMRLPCKRFALLNFESRHEDSLSTLLSAPPGTQRLLGASVPSRAEIDRAAPRPSYAEAEVDGESDGGGEGGGEAARAAGCAEGRESLDKERFARFVEGAKSKLPFLAEVAWTGERDVSDARAQMRSALLDLTAPGSGDGRRMYVELLHETVASSEQAWHFEVRWLMCQATQVEDLLKYCARRARAAGLLIVQTPTMRRPRPFVPKVLVPVPRHLHARAIGALCAEVGFVRECGAVGSERWVHEHGVAFARRDPLGRGFVWIASRLINSQAARDESQKLLARFRERCAAIEAESLEAARAEAARAPAPPGPAAAGPRGAEADAPRARAD